MSHVQHTDMEGMDLSCAVRHWGAREGFHRTDSSSCEVYGIFVLELMNGTY